MGPIPPPFPSGKGCRSMSQLFSHSNDSFRVRVRGIWVNRLWCEAADENGCLRLARDAFLPKEIYTTVFEGIALV